MARASSAKAVESRPWRMGGNSAASAVQGCAAEESGEENGRPRTGGGKGPIEKMGTQNRQKKMRNGRAERRTPLRMGKIKLQTEHRREKTEERFTQFVSLGHLSTAGMPIGTVGVAAAQAGHARAEDERDHADVMTDAATVLSDYEGSPEESELFERARRLGEANLLDVWGGRPSTRSNAPLPSTTASLLPQKTPSRLQPRASATSERRVDDSALVHPGSRSLLPHASAPRRSIQPTGSGTLSTSHRLGASPRLWRVTSAPTSHQSGRDQGQLSSSSGYGSGRGTCNALDNEGILPLRSASSSATAKGKSAAENERCGGCSCEEGSALRREVDFLKHIIATRSIRSDASPLADASIADGDTSSSSRMSPLLQDAPPNASQQALHSSPPLVPRPPPSGNRFHSPECSGPGRCNGRTSTCSSAREHPASARTAPVASIFLGQGHEGEAAARRSIARPRRVSNPASADNLVDEDVFFSKAGSLDGGIASAPRNCAPKQVTTSPAPLLFHHFPLPLALPLPLPSSPAALFEWHAFKILISISFQMDRPAPPPFTSHLKPRNKISRLQLHRTRQG